MTARLDLRYTRRFKYIGVFSLIVLLCAFFVHSNHLSEHDYGVEFQHCHVCQHVTDTPTLPSAIVANIFTHCFERAFAVNVLLVTPLYFGLPQQRAPPQFL